MKTRDQRRLGLIGLADDGNHLVNIEQHQRPALQNMDTVQNLVQPVPGPPLDSGLAERNPLGEHLFERFLCWPAVQANHGQVDRAGGFQAGVRQQRVDQLLLANPAGFGLTHQAHRRVLAGLITHHIQHRQHGGLELVLLQRQGFFAGLDFGVAEFFNFFQHALGTDTWGQFGHHQLPLAARQVFNFPAGPAFERTPATAISLGYLARTADDLATTGKVRAGNECKQLVIRQLWCLDQGDTGIGHLTQVVAGNFGGQAHGNAAGPIEQRKRQSSGQLAWLLGRAIVIGCEIDRAFVNFVKQQAGNPGQPRFRVTHGRSTVTIAAAKVTLPVNQGITLGKVLRHAHQCVVGGTVAVWVVTAQHITHHSGALDRLGTHIAVDPAEAQAHAAHGVQNAPLHGFLAVAHIGNCTALDHAQGIFKVGALGVTGQVEGIIKAFWLCWC